MKQTRADTSIAIVQAVGLHALLFVLLFAGLWFTRTSAVPNAQGDPIEADLASVSDLSASMRRTLQRAPIAPPPVARPEPLPKPLPDDLPSPSRTLPPPVPDPAPVEQDKVQRDAVLPPPPNVRKEQDEQRRQPDQAELDAKRQTEMERQRLKQLEEVRRLREAASRERSMAEQRAQQLADARAPGPASAPPPSPGNRGTDPGLAAKYAAALQQAILRQWTRPETVALGQRCRITIHQIPGGDVASVEISPGCPYDALGRRSVETAVLKAAPLPYAGFESVFSRKVDLNFVAEDR